MEIIQTIRSKYEALLPFMDERLRRVWAGAEARSLGHGGIGLVAEATGMSRNTVVAGRAELDRVAESGEPPPERLRQPGGGRKGLGETDPMLVEDLKKLIEPATRGEPDSPLLWTCKSSTALAGALQHMGHEVSERSVLRRLHELGYSLQAPSKSREISSHPDRNAQFEHINEQVKAFQERGQPVVSVDAKKKELVGDFKNGGREWQLTGQPEPVRVHDFQDQVLGKAGPFGIYDVTANMGWVSVGIDHDTAEFAVATLERWWDYMGNDRYPKAKELLVIADGGGSNSSRSRLWKRELQRFADDSGLNISVCHLPPGTSKWNQIEHRLFAFITKNWRGRPLVSLQVIVNLIANTRNRTGLLVDAELDTNRYLTGLKVSKEEFAQLQIVRSDFHGDWNYTISSRIPNK
jgi:DDE family transposase